MRDQPTQRDVAAELDQAERVVLDLLLDPEIPGLWSLGELAVSLGGEVRAADAVSGLQRAGLVHRLDEFVFASRPAARCMQLADAL